jgi:hypothetical protein
MTSLLSRTNREQDVDAEFVRSVFDYDCETGALSWRAKIARNTPIGERAGYVGPQGYRVVQMFGRRWMEHRLIWIWVTGAWPSFDIDHVNCTRSDNRWGNLREATRSQNNGNMPRPVHNRSGVKGVFWDKSRNRWQAQIKIRGRSTSLGRFDSKESAAAAYEAAARQHFGEFARSE